MLHRQAVEISEWSTISLFKHTYWYTDDKARLRRRSTKWGCNEVGRCLSPNLQRQQAHLGKRAPNMGRGRSTLGRCFLEDDEVDPLTRVEIDPIINAGTFWGCSSPGVERHSNVFSALVDGLVGFNAMRQSWHFGCWRCRWIRRWRWGWWRRCCCEQEGWVKH